MSKKYRIKMEAQAIEEQFECDGIAGVKLVLLPSAILELDGKTLVVLRRSRDSENHVIVKDEMTGNTYEVSEGMLEEIA